jgi:elongator complex protein 3
MTLEQYCKEIIRLIESGKIKDKQQLNAYKAKLAARYALTKMPTNPTIMRFAKRRSQRVLKLLAKKPVRSLSGINVVAIMAKPYPCPGKCIYCPSSQVNVPTPKSYTGREPATMRALQAGFDPKKQIRDRIRQLTETGHKANKIELIVMGGTFLATPLNYQKNFVRNAIDAITGCSSKTLAEAKLKAETAKRRIIGITFETRPDYCKKEHVNRMLAFGGTRCELGVQILNDTVYKKISRGHSVADVVRATKLLKDAGFKVCYHCMPGLPYTRIEDDLESFKRMFFSEEFRPDNIKIYPCLVLKGTKLYEEYIKGNYEPLDTKKAVQLIAKVKQFVPPWVRIMRVQRDIPAKLIDAGVKKSNLRQLVHSYMKKRGQECNCIRCREAALKEAKEGIAYKLSDARLFIDEYKASGGTELFLSLEDKERKHLFAYCRLRIPEHSFRREISDKNAIVRELRVLGEPLLLGEHSKEALQHKGMGAKLLTKAEYIAKEVFDKKGMVVIAGIGVREYYRKKFGYVNKGPYVYKKL